MNMNAIRVCRLSDAVCTRGCGEGSCKTAMAKLSTASTASPQPRLSLKGLEAAVEKLRGIPPAKWMLVAPDGRVWSDEDPMKLAQVCASAKFGWLEIPDILPPQTKEGPA